MDSRILYTVPSGNMFYLSCGMWHPIPGVWLENQKRHDPQAGAGWFRGAASLHVTYILHVNVHVHVHVLNRARETGYAGAAQ